VDDEPAVSQTIAAIFGALGNIAETAPTLAQARLMLERDYEMLVLDMVLPDGDGLDLLHWLKHVQRRSLPIIMVTAVSRQDVKLKAFDLGADDYILKPFSPQELSARSAAVLRRCYGSNVVRFGPYRLDLVARTLQRGVVPVHLRPKEFDVLAMLAKHSGEAVTREALFEQIWTDRPSAARQAVAVAIHTLREKIEDSNGQPRYIRTVSRYGYRFDPGD